MSSFNVAAVAAYLVVTLGVFFALRLLVLPMFGVSDLLGLVLALLPALFAGRFVRSYFERQGNG